jgi:tetrahydromethanopterin S-methyltransferase subunit E
MIRPYFLFCLVKFSKAIAEIVAGTLLGAFTFSVISIVGQDPAASIILAAQLGAIIGGGLTTVYKVTAFFDSINDEKKPLASEEEEEEVESKVDLGPDSMLEEAKKILKSMK